MKANRILLGAAALVCAFLLYRVFSLERRVDALVSQVGDADTPPAAVAKAKVVVDHGERIEALEQDLDTLRADLALIEQQTHSKVDMQDLDETVSEDRILSVVTGEAERIRDRQLEFHRERWLEYRDKAVDDFVARFDIAPHDEQRLRALLADEIESMTELVKSEDMLENPEQAASDWAAVLLETDRRVEPLLTPEQREVWRQSRYFERRVLWPWLPEPLEQ